MEEEVNISQIQKPELMEQQYPEQKNDLFEEFLIESLRENTMEIQKIQKPFHSRSSKTLNKRSDFRKILNSSSSNQRLIPSSLKHDSSRQNSLFLEELNNNNQNSFDQESFRKSFKKKFQQSFSISHTVKDSSSSFSERSDSKSSRNIIIIPHVYDQQNQMEEEKKVGCNCKRSRCLKLYCQCFQKQMFCGQNCNCQNCGNLQSNKQQHKQAIVEALARNAHTNSHGFEMESKEERENVPEKKVFSLEVGHEEVKKGCKCKKTKCLKKYCECYQSGVFCTIFCRCEGCYNKQQYQNNTASVNGQLSHLMKNI